MLIDVTAGCAIVFLSASSLFDFLLLPFLCVLFLPCLRLFLLSFFISFFFSLFFYYSATTTAFSFIHQRWGLIPSYHKKDVRDFKLTTFNCKHIRRFFSKGSSDAPCVLLSFSFFSFSGRVEGLDKASGIFARPLKAGKRCVVLVDGFFEWRAADSTHKTKQPFFVHPRKDGAGHKLLAMAGLYETCHPKDSSEPVTSCTIITVPGEWGGGGGGGGANTIVC